MPSKPAAGRKPVGAQRRCAKVRIAQALFGLIASFAACALTQSKSPPTLSPLSPVIVTATRIDSLPFDVPASIDFIDGDSVRAGHAQVNISESLGAVPGLLARDRQNYAQDVQISVRGFGARSTFGIRGVRLYVDDIPATLPDGQGQISNVDLGSVGGIEVLRGPFSALYGNSSGGVIQVYTRQATRQPQLGFSIGGGSDGAARLGIQASSATGTNGALGYVISTSRFQTDGFRDHSRAARSLNNVKLTWTPDADRKLTLVANSVNLPYAQDPLGLSRGQFEANPRGVDPSARIFNTRKSVSQTQTGVIYQCRLDAANALRVLIYGGQRGNEQFQSIPVATQAAALHPGGVISLARNYGGTDLRWTHKAWLMNGPLTLVAGLAYDTMDEHRQGYQNFLGTLLGVRGALRRDERNNVTNFDQYLQAAWKMSPQWSLNAGLRHSKVRFNSADSYVSGANGNDSGSTNYYATLPVLGLMFAATPDVHLYTAIGRGFETPTLNEVAYRASGSGLNLGLQAARSNNVEVGVKARQASVGELTTAVFLISTDDEIVTQTNLGGRSTFQNAGATLRRGVELGWSKTYSDNLQAQLAMTVLDATYQNTFRTCLGTPCATTNQVIPSGNRIPGVAQSSIYVALNWTPQSGWRGGIDARQISKVYVNDANSDAAASYAVAAANVGYMLNAGVWELGGYLRVENLFDRTYAGSVIVNEGNSRFFEPATGRTWWGGVSATLKF